MKKLLSVTLFSGLLTLVRIASGFFISKVVAIYTGPSGMAMLGQVQSLVSALNGIATAPASNGVVRYTAEHHSQGYEACAPWWRASLRWLLSLLAIIVPFVCLSATPLANWLFGSAHYSWLVIVATLALPLSAANTLLASVLNGQQQYKRYVGLGMLSVLLATILMLGLIVSHQLTGALLAATLFSACSGLIMILGVLHLPWLRWTYWMGKCNTKQLKGIGGYVAMAITSSICLPVSMIAVRNILIDHVGWQQAGYWQAVYKISEVYLSIITMALGTYYMPRLSGLKDSNSIHEEITSTSKIIIPTVIILSLSIYKLKDTLILLLFTADFQPASKLFSVQLIGDVLKIASWLFAYPMLSKKLTKLFISTEIFFSLNFTILAFIFVKFYGTQGANIAYTLNYACYFTFSYAYVKKFIR